MKMILEKKCEGKEVVINWDESCMYPKLQVRVHRSFPKGGFRIPNRDITNEAGAT